MADSEFLRPATTDWRIEELNQEKQSLLVRGLRAKIISARLATIKDAAADYLGNQLNSDINMLAIVSGRVYLPTAEKTTVSALQGLIGHVGAFLSTGSLAYIANGAAPEAALAVTRGYEPLPAQTLQLPGFVTLSERRPTDQARVPMGVGWIALGRDSALATAAIGNPFTGELTTAQLDIDSILASRYENEIIIGGEIRGVEKSPLGEPFL